MSNTYIEHYTEQSFDWLAWRNGSLINTLRIPHRTELIVLNKNIIRKYAVGWCKADNIPCRPKKDHIAVMFYNENLLDNYWTHLTIEEFKKCFPELNYFI